MSANENINRRDFLKGMAASSVGLALGVQALTANADTGSDTAAKATADPYAGAPVKCAVIGLGPRGREILSSLAKMPQNSAPVVGMCDTWTDPYFIKKSTDIIPNVTVQTDYRKILDDNNVQAVFVATPSYLHKQITLDALAAGKHVYCEAPMSSDLDEAKVIAQAGAAAKTVFQPGMQYRSNGMHLHVMTFVRAMDFGIIFSGRSQWHRRGSWKRVDPSDARMKALNWRMYKDTSSGLAGEIGIHQLDVFTWVMNHTPISVQGYGGIIEWGKDGMQVPDTIEVIIQYPNNVNCYYDASLVTSFDGAFESVFGNQASVVIRDQNAWMFKESDAPLIGWEVYAKRETMGIGDTKTGTGIMLVADATKQLLLGKQPASVGNDVSKTALYQSVGAFLNTIRDPKANPLKCTAQDGYTANVVALKTNESILTGQKITFDPSMFTL
jgi:predicted dehydrogenase